MTDITRKRGDTYADEFVVKSTTTGSVIDITGYSFSLVVDPQKHPASSANNLYALTGTITDAANGLVEFAPSAVQSDQTPKIYYYEVQMTDPTGRIRTIESGKYTYVQDIVK